MKNTADPTIAGHAGHTIRLEPSTGLFYVDLGESNKPITDKSLDGIKRKLDERARAAARQAAANLPAVVFQWGGWSREHKPEWTEGAFVSLNAHTGDVTLTVKGRPVDVSGGWFFRKGDPAIETVRSLVLAQVAAEKAYEKAKETLNNALEKHGLQIRLGRYSGKDKAAQAAAAEQKLVEHLGGAA